MIGYVVHDDDVVSSLEVVQLMCDQHTRGVPQVAVDALVEELAAHVRVHGRERVVQQVDIGLVTKLRVYYGSKKSPTEVEFRMCYLVLGALAGNNWTVYIQMFYLFNVFT